MGIILMIDDSPAAVHAVMGTLQRVGHEFHSAEDWHETRGILSETLPDLVLVDVQLGGLVSGDVLAMQLRRYPKLKRAKIVFHSASSTKDLVRWVKKTGIDGYILKSDDPVEFLNQVHKFIEAPKAGAVEA